MWASVLAKSLQSCLTLSDPVDCSLPGSSVHGILQARILEWDVMPSSRRSYQPRDQTCVSGGFCIAGRFFTTEPPRKPSTLTLTSHLACNLWARARSVIMAVNHCVLAGRPKAAGRLFPADPLGKLPVGEDLSDHPSKHTLDPFSPRSFPCLSCLVSHKFYMWKSIFPETLGVSGTRCDSYLSPSKHLISSSFIEI